MSSNKTTYAKYLLENICRLRFLGIIYKYISTGESQNGNFIVNQNDRAGGQ